MSSVSSYSSFIPNYPQSPLLMQISQLAMQLGQQQYSWAQQQFASNSVLTDQVVNNFLAASQISMNNAQNMSDRYTNVFQPQENALIRDANTYASDARVRQEMGRAQSDVSQAFDASKGNLERQLQAYGINPSDGRYAELQHAEDAQRAAAGAQAGQNARYNTENVGRQLRQQAIQVGQQYPANVVNALNNAMQGYAAAENAKLSNTNTGVNAFNSAKGFLDTASALKYPPLGQQGSSSKGTILNSTPPQPPGRSGSGGAGQGGGAGGGFGTMGGAGGPDWSTLNHSGYDPRSYNALAPGNMGGGNYGSLAKFIEGPDSDTYDINDYSNMNTYQPDYGNNFSGYDQNIYQGGGSDPFSDYYGGYNTGDDYYGSDYYGGYDDPYGWSMGSSPQDQYDYGGWQDVQDPWGTGTDNSGYDPSIWDSQNYNDYGVGQGGDYSYDPSQDYSPQPDYSYDAGSYSGDDYYGDTSGYSYDSYDSGGGGDYGLDYSSGDWGDYAAGGAIPDGRPPMSGRVVPRQASPSMGQQTDDVNAHVNVGEFIIPEDVSRWKGEEFFQKLIQQSRKARSGAPAKGKPSNRPTNGPPSFVSPPR